MAYMFQKWAAESRSAIVVLLLREQLCAYIFQKGAQFLNRIPVITDMKVVLSVLMSVVGGSCSLLKTCHIYYKKWEPLIVIPPGAGYFLATVFSLGPSRRRNQAAPNDGSGHKELHFPQENRMPLRSYSIKISPRCPSMVVSGRAN
jgi:hypothetical protein